MGTNYVILGILLAKIEFWSDQYEFSFQFWGDDNNQVYIYRESVELVSMGQSATVQQIINRALEWCEKANPRKKYPDELTAIDTD